MTEAGALQLLESYTPRDHTWGSHSVTVARAAGHIADALRRMGATVDPEIARVGVLLHDIGRGITHDFAGHAWEGYRLLLARGEPQLARFCITHQCGGLTPEEAPLVGWPPHDYRPRSWKEKAVTIADGLGYGGRIVFLSDRCADVRERCRDTVDPARYALLVGVEGKIRAFMAEIEAITLQSVEDICGAERL
jgi:putative nucleotidyltransferase with HDIG domain